MSSSFIAHSFNNIRFYLQKDLLPLFLAASLSKSLKHIISISILHQLRHIFFDFVQNQVELWLLALLEKLLQYSASIMAFCKLGYFVLDFTIPGCLRICRITYIIFRVLLFFFFINVTIIIVGAIFFLLFIVVVVVIVVANIAVIIINHYFLLILFRLLFLNSSLIKFQLLLRNVLKRYLLLVEFLLLGWQLRQLLVQYFIKFFRIDGFSSSIKTANYLAGLILMIR